MRNVNLYAVYDKKAKAIVGNIVHAVSEVPIVREFTTAVNRDGMIGQNPEDFIVLELGQLDEETATILALEQPTVVTTGLAQRRPE